jgi:hypothetical protein
MGMDEPPAWVWWLAALVLIALAPLWCWVLDRLDKE